MLINLTLIVDWHVVTARKQRQVDIDISYEHTRRIRHDCSVGNIVYVEKKESNTIILQIHRLYIVTGVFTNGTVQFYRGTINKQINIRRIEPYSDSVNPMP